MFFTCFRHATLFMVSLRQMQHLSESGGRSSFPGLLWVLLKQKSENELHLTTRKTIRISGLCKQIFQSPLCASSMCNDYRIRFSAKSRGTYNHCNSTCGYMSLRIDFIFSRFVYFRESKELAFNPQHYLFGRQF